MMRLVLTFLLGLSLVPPSALALQRGASELTDVFVYPIWGLGGDPFSEVRVELLDTGNKIVAVGVSTMELPVVVLRGLNRSTYTLRLTHESMNTVVRTVQLFRPEHWFTQTLYSNPPGYGYLPPEELAVAKNLGTLQGTVVSMPTVKEPMWARLMGIFSTVIVDSRVKPDGSFEFRVEPGWYVLILARGTQVCAMQQLHSFRTIAEGPLTVTLASACRQ